MVIGWGWRKCRSRYLAVGGLDNEGGGADVGMLLLEESKQVLERHVLRPPHLVRGVACMRKRWGERKGVCGR